NAKNKVSFYYSRGKSETTNLVGNGQADGLPRPITQARGSFYHSQTYRASYDNTITPTLLMHLGIGLVDFKFTDDSPELEFDDASIGLKGIPAPFGRFPYITGLNAANGTGGMANMGPLAQSEIHEIRPTANVSFTWVRNNHTYKAGADMIIDGYPSQILAASVGQFNFSSTAAAPYTLSPGTSNPYLLVNNTSGANAGF